MAFSSSSSENNYGETGSYRRLRRAPAAIIDQTSDPAQSSNAGPQFDIIAWYPKYQSCQRYFLDHAQHEPLVQAFAAFVNIRLPYQRDPKPIFNSAGARSDASRLDKSIPAPSQSTQVMPTVSLLPYIRRLVVTGMDVPQVLHGFFGNDWAAGVGPQREQERRNYMFAAKSGGWASVKRDYDMLPLETVPFMRPLFEPTDGEIEAAEKAWSEWLALEDWMVGSRAPK